MIPQLLYVGSSLKEASLVESVITSVADVMAPTYRWSAHGSVRGNPKRLAEVATHEISGEFDAGAQPKGVGIFLLSRGLGDSYQSGSGPQRGLHVELGAFLAGRYSAALADAPGGRALLWVPPEHSDALDNPKDDKMLSFYLHPGVSKIICPREEVVERVSGWIRER